MNGARGLGWLGAWVIEETGWSGGVGGPTHRDEAAMNGARGLGWLGEQDGWAVLVDPLIAMKPR